MLSAVCGASGDRHCHPINIIAAAPSPRARVVATIPAIGSPLLRAPPPLIYLCLRRRRRRLRHQCIVKRAQSAFSSPSIRERLSILPYASLFSLYLQRLPSPHPPTTDSLFPIAVPLTQGTTNLLLLRRSYYHNVYTEYCDVGTLGTNRPNLIILAVCEAFES